MKKLVNAIYPIDTDWEDETISKNLLKKGSWVINIENDTIKAGSVFYMQTNMWLAMNDLSITGSKTTGDNWVILHDTGTDLEASYTTTTPTYSYDLKGWYVGNDRAIYYFDWDGSNENHASIITDISHNDYTMKYVDDTKDYVIDYINTH